MELSTMISVFHDVANTVFSFIQLIFTEIIPVFALFVASLLSSIFCSIRSFVSGAPNPSRSSPINSVAPDLCAPLQEEESDQDHDDTTPRDDGFSSDDAAPSPFDDTGISTLRQGERQRSLSTQEWKETSQDQWQGSLSTQERAIPDELLLRDLSTRNENPAVAPVVYASDLPESLDDVERRAKPDHLLSQHKRTLPPSLSMVKRTLRESSNKVPSGEESQETASGGGVRRRTSKDGKTTGAAPAKALRSQSEKSPESCSPTDCVTTKFKKYFSIDQ